MSYARRYPLTCQWCDIGFMGSHTTRKFCSLGCSASAQRDASPCKVADCESGRLALGLCANHYAQKRRGEAVKAGPGSGWWRGCSICNGGRRLHVETLLLSGEPIESVADLIGRSVQAVYYHIRHADLPELPTRIGRRCSVCLHPMVWDIDDALADRVERGNPRGSLAEIERAFGVGGHSLRNHATAEHQQRRALYELGRLNALKETA